MKTISFSIEGMTCGHCLTAVRSALSSIPGIESAQVTMGAATIRLAESAETATEATAARTAEAISDAGYPARIAAAAAAPLAASAATGARTGGSCCSTSIA